MCTAELFQTYSVKLTINFITETKYAYDKGKKQTLPSTTQFYTSF